jgi:hypothetical protein
MGLPVDPVGYWAKRGRRAGPGQRFVQKIAVAQCTLTRKKVDYLIAVSSPERRVQTSRGSIRKSHSGLIVWILLPALIRSLLPVCRLLGVCKKVDYLIAVSSPERRVQMYTAQLLFFGQNALSSLDRNGLGRALLAGYRQQRDRGRGPAVSPITYWVDGKPHSRKYAGFTR